MECEVSASDDAIAGIEAGSLYLSSGTPTFFMVHVTQRPGHLRALRDQRQFRVSLSGTGAL
jgi:hypothetical protein